MEAEATQPTTGLANHPYYRDLFELVKGEGLEEVARLDDGGGSYDWNEMGVYRDPRTGRFFWVSEGGCSCSYFGFYTDSLADMYTGDRNAVLEAVRDYEVASDEQRNRACAAIRNLPAVSA